MRTKFLVEEFEGKIELQRTRDKLEDSYFRGKMSIVD
jgi:hypothetical protein